MASGQHTQVRDWAVQHLKKPWSYCACSRVSSKFQPRPTVATVMTGSAGKEALKQLRNCVFSCTRLRNIPPVWDKHWSTAYRRHVFPAQKRTKEERMSHLQPEPSETVPKNPES